MQFQERDSWPNSVLNESFLGLTCTHAYSTVRCEIPQCPAVLRQNTEQTDSLLIGVNVDLEDVYPKVSGYTAWPTRKGTDLRYQADILLKGTP